MSNKEYGYEMLDVRLVIKVSCHVSCLQQVIDKAKDMGILRELDAKWYEDNSPKFGDKV